jgi:hypothetical protein
MTDQKIIGTKEVMIIIAGSNEFNKILKSKYQKTRKPKLQFEDICQLVLRLKKSKISLIRENI